MLLTPTGMVSLKSGIEDIIRLQFWDNISLQFWATLYHIYYPPMSTIDMRAAGVLLPPRHFSLLANTLTFSS